MLLDGESPCDSVTPGYSQEADSFTAHHVTFVLQAEGLRTLQVVKYKAGAEGRSGVIFLSFHDRKCKAGIQTWVSVPLTCFLSVPTP